MATVHRIPGDRQRKNKPDHVPAHVDETGKALAPEREASMEVLRRQAALLELAHDAMFVRDMDSRITYWNKAAERLYGWDRSEAMGKISNELLSTRFPIPLKDIEAVVLEKGEWVGELIQTTRHNKLIILESRWALERDESGTPVAMLEINRDITARKVAESSAREYQLKLERSVQELRDFAFIASHDLKEPLRKLSTFSGILEDKFAGALGEQGQAYLYKIQNATERMQKLIESLLTYSRVTTKAEPFVSVDLGELANDVIADLEVPIQETGAKVEVGALPRIQVDPGQIRHVFQNLVENALKFHDGTPNIRIYGEACWDGMCKIYVEDDGIGFDEKHLDLIFQPFKRLHGRSSPYRGSGMGLAICRKIVERHNGTIGARSAPGKGSVFIVTLPMKQCGENEACAA